MGVVRIIKDVEQRSDEWLDLRLGRVGGSEIIGVTTAARLKTLLYSKVAEITTGEIPFVHITPAMQRGIDEEQGSKEIYEADKLVEVEEVGYVVNSDYLHGGLSPDGLIGKNGAIEIKNPNSSTHAQTIIEKKIPSKNLPQVLWYFIIMGKLEYVDFVSCDSRNKKIPYFCIRANRSDFKKEISKLDSEYKKYEEKLLEALKIFK